MEERKALFLRVSAEEKERIEYAAWQARKSVNEWAAEILAKASKPKVKGKP